ncbi:MAG: hypothetical protein AAB434_04075 [Planctomycetota bacterium]
MASPTDIKILSDLSILVRGAGRAGTAIARRLVGAGIPRVALTELPTPRTPFPRATFAGALLQGEIDVEGLRAKKAEYYFEFVNIWGDGMVPVFADPAADVKERFLPIVLVDAAGVPHETRPDPLDAPMIVGIGPGFAATEVHARVVVGGPSNGRLVYPGRPEWGVVDCPQELPSQEEAGVPPWARGVAGAVLEAVVALFNLNFSYKGYPRRPGTLL